MPLLGRERGQSSVELVALLPILAVLLLGLIQASLAGFAAWSVATAARAGARAVAVGKDPRPAVRGAAPIGGAGARIERRGDTLRVHLPIPAVLPVSLGFVSSDARFEAQR